MIHQILKLKPAAGQEHTVILFAVYSFLIKKKKKYIYFCIYFYLISLSLNRYIWICIVSNNVVRYGLAGRRHQKRKMNLSDLTVLWGGTAMCTTCSPWRAALAMLSWGFSNSGVGTACLALSLIQMACMCCILTSFHYTTVLPTPTDLFIHDTHHQTQEAKGKKIQVACHANIETN